MQLFRNLRFGYARRRVFPNPNKDAEDGAGPASAQLLASRNVEKIVSGEFGLKIKELLDRLKIQMIIIKEPDKKLNEIIALLKQHL